MLLNKITDLNFVKEKKIKTTFCALEDRGK